MSVNTFKEALDSSGMVDTRRNSLKYALETLHNSISQMDAFHLAVLQRDYPDILNAARTYAAYERGLNRFEDVKPLLDT